MLQTIVGRRGTGKTSLAWWAAQRYSGARVFILDYKGDFGSLASSKITVVRYTRPEDVRAFCELAWDAADKRSRTLVVLDEIRCYGRDNEDIAFLYRMGREWNIDIIAIAHKFYDLSEYVRALTDFYNVFQIINPTDINYLKGYLDDSLVKTILSLDNFTFVTLSF
ncbi:MAG: ATP-binding protein [Candidatus Aminicenantes bacterium]|nr:ATP-binding protein [Candidatus Aminicenantes bacterium]